MRTLIVFYAAALLASPAYCKIATPVPDVLAPREGRLKYVGNYGETLNLLADYRIEAAMHGGVEVINYGPRSGWDSHLTPENFARNGVIQLIIMPRSLSSFKTLDELREAKVRELRDAGADVRVGLDPYPSGDFPAGSFDVEVKAPYHLGQLYTGTNDYLCILTYGIESMPRDIVTYDHAEVMRFALRDFVAPKRDEFKTPLPFDVPNEDLSFHPFTRPRIWGTWLAITLGCLLIVMLLRRVERLRGLRRTALSLLAFSNAGAVVGFLAGLAAWQFATSWAPVRAACIGGILLMPALAWPFARTRSHRWRVVGGLAAFSILAAAYVTPYLVSALHMASDPRPYVPALTSIVLFVVYGVGGVVFSLLAAGVGEPVLALALLAALAPVVQAQQASGSHGIEESAARRLAVQNLVGRGETRAKAEDDAVDDLKRKDEYFDLQRVEITGVWSNDDTDKSFKGLFDLMIKPSAKAEPPPPSPRDDRGMARDPEAKPGAEQAIPWLSGSIFDPIDARNSVLGQVVDANAKVKTMLQEKYVNEIVAHSWGTEIVYYAILHGDIKPPRRLIVVGVPDSDLAKWAALSRYTGTEVILRTHAHDKVVEFSQMTAAPYPSRGPNAFNAEWEAACNKPGRVCNPRGRIAPKPVLVPKAPDFGDDPKQHDRFDYYHELQAAKVLPTRENDARMLKAAQDAHVAKAAAGLYDARVKAETAAVRSEAVRAAGLSQTYDEFRAKAEEAKRELESDRAKAERARLVKVVAEEQAEARARSFAQRSSDADQLGFRELFRSELGDSAYGFELKVNPWVKFYYRNGGFLSDEQASGVFGIARACLDVEDAAFAHAPAGWLSPETESGTLPGLNANIGKRWYDPQYREGLYLAKNDSQAKAASGKYSDEVLSCVNNIVATLQAPLDPDILESLLKGFRQSVDSRIISEQRRNTGTVSPGHRNDPVPPPPPWTLPKPAPGQTPGSCTGGDHWNASLNRCVPAPEPKGPKEPNCRDYDLCGHPTIPRW